MKSEETIEVIKVIEHGEEHYHRKPSNGRYQFYPTAEIPVKLFESYIEARSLMMYYRGRIRRYFVPLKDKPMRVEKNHVNEGEVHRFGVDGSVTVIRSD